MLLRMPQTRRPPCAPVLSNFECDSCQKDPHTRHLGCIVVDTLEGAHGNHAATDLTDEELAAGVQVDFGDGVEVGVPLAVADVGAHQVQSQVVELEDDAMVGVGVAADGEHERSFRDEQAAPSHSPNAGNGVLWSVPRTIATATVATPTGRGRADWIARITTDEE